MTDIRLLTGKTIEFNSIRHGRVIAKLLSYNSCHIQVELVKQIQTERRIWYSGEVRLFDMDKVSGIELTEYVNNLPLKGRYQQRKQEKQIAERNRKRRAAYKLNKR